MTEVLERYYASQSEREFQETVIELARWCGWLVAHFHDSRREVVDRRGQSRLVGDRDTAGFPDLVLVHPRWHRLVFAELKRSGKRPTLLQQVWLSALEQVPGVEVYLWWPEDMRQIRRVLGVPEAAA